MRAKKNSLFLKNKRIIITQFLNKVNNFSRNSTFFFTVFFIFAILQTSAPKKNPAFILRNFSLRFSFLLRFDAFFAIVC